MGSKFGHPILHRSFCRVLCLYHTIFSFLSLAFECTLWPFCNSALFYNPLYVCTLPWLPSFFFLKNSTLPKIQHPNISLIIFTLIFSYFFFHLLNAHFLLIFCNVVVTLRLPFLSLRFSMQ